MTNPHLGTERRGNGPDPERVNDSRKTILGSHKEIAMKKNEEPMSKADEALWAVLEPVAAIAYRRPRRR